MSAMTATVEQGKKGEPATLVIRLPINDPAALPLSSTGKTRIVATSHGNQATTVMVAGQPVKIGVTAFVKA